MKKAIFITLLALFFLVLTPNVLAITNTLFLGDYEIQYTYLDAQEGEKFTLTVEIQNIEDTKEDVVFELSSNNPFDVDNDDTWEIGNLTEGETQTNTFRVEIDEDTPEGEYDLEFDLEDSEDDYTDEFEIDITSDNADLIIGDISSTPSTILPDEDDIELKITIENLGGGDATFTQARLKLPSGFTPSTSFSDQTNIGTVAAKSSKTASFFIDTSETISSSLNTAQIILEYKDDIERKTRTLEFDIPVKGKPIFTINSATTNPREITAGTQDGTLSISITNIGDEEGLETSIRIFENSDQPFEFNEKTNFIGNLEQGMSGTATFTFNVEDDAITKTHLVKIQTRTVNNGNVIVDEQTIPIAVKQAEQQGISPILIILIIGIIVLILVYLIARKR